MDNPNTMSTVPNHLPKIKPPTRNTGDPKPNKRTQTMVPIKKIILDKKILLFLIFSKTSLFSLINS